MLALQICPIMHLSCCFHYNPEFIFFYVDEHEAKSFPIKKQ